MTKDLGRAAEWYRKSAEQGYAVAQYKLGRCYDYGDGIEHDCQKAVEWYRKSVEQGCAMAQCDLGNCYKHGRGVEKNLEKAVEWYRKSAEQGYDRDSSPWLAAMNTEKVCRKTKKKPCNGIKKRLIRALEAQSGPLRICKATA